MAELFERLAGHAALGVEAIAVVVIVYGAAEAAAATLALATRHNDTTGSRRAIWLRFARWLLLGLEYSLAADIIRTAIAPTWDDLGQLAVIAAVRTFLNFFLERDIREIGEGMRRSAAAVILLLALPAAAAAQGGSPAAEAGSVTMWNRPIVTFRATVEGRTPEVRADATRVRLADLPVAAVDWPVTASPIQVGGLSGIIVRVGTTPAFVLVAGDVDPGIDLQQTAGEAVAQLRAGLRARADQQRWSVRVRGGLHVLLASLVALVAFTVLRRIQGSARQPMERAMTRASERVPWMHPELRARVASLGRPTLGAAASLARFIVMFFWVTYALLQFPLSAPLGERLASRFSGLLSQLAVGFVQAIPGLFVVMIILFIARALTQVMNVIFSLIGSGTLNVAWLHRDTAHATSRVVMVLIWAAALLAAYPYIPGSDTDAFKGLSLLLGLVASIGSAGIAGQAMSGLSAIYSRTFRAGEFVRVGDVQGSVLSVGLLATKLMTAAREEVTIPNSVLVASPTTNFSRLLKDGGASVTIAVGVGYDVPWRQVHALLLLAASRTPGLTQEPPPRVEQRNLLTFNIEYVLFTFAQPGQSPSALRSALHSNVQDAFNEFGVQIMTPAYESQPDQRVMVPQSRWHMPPAQSGPSLPRGRTAGGHTA